MASEPHRAELVDPRIERSRLVVRQAALIEFAESGYGGFTIESVAARAGVGRSTVYRHWGSKLALISDALETLNEQPAPDLSAASPREGVELLLRHLELLFQQRFPARDTHQLDFRTGQIDAAGHQRDVLVDLMDRFEEAAVFDEHVV